MGTGRDVEGGGACLGKSACRDQLGERVLAGERAETAVLADGGYLALVLVFV